MIRGKRALQGPIAMVAIIASLALAAPASADQIAFNCGEDICLINPDNPAEQSNLTETHGSSGSEGFPAWSPDGKLIAFRGLFVPSAFETWNIYTLDPAEPAPREATNVSQASDRAAYFDYPDWSPDGTRLAWASTASSANPVQTGVYVGAAAGTSLPVQVGKREGNFPTWSADSAKIAFSSTPENVYTALPNGSDTAAGLPGAFGLEPRWSPNGALIASNRWTTPRKIRISKADGSGGIELPQASDLGTLISWSPDSTRVVYVADEEPLDRVRVAPADGSGPGVPIAMPAGWIVPHNPSFSPDGTRVAFTARQSPGPGYEQLLVAPADGSAPAVAITSSAMQNQQPAWKPGPGSGPKPPGGGGPIPPATQPPVKVKLSLYKNPRLVGGGYKHMLLAGIDCHAQGGHPTGAVAEFCAANASAYPQGRAPAGLRAWARPKAKPSLFAKGSVRVPVGKTKPLKLKITAAGKKLLKPDKKIKLKVSITLKNPGGKPTTSTKTVTLKVPAKK